MPSSPLSDAEMMLHYAEIEGASFGDYYQRFRPSLLREKPFLWPYIEEAFQSVFDRIGTRDTILDIGCGTAFYHPILSRFARDIIGVDFSASMLTKASQLRELYEYSGSDFLVGDIRHMPIGSGSVDCVFSWDVLHHVTGKEGLKAVIREVYRVLKDGGYYVGFEPNILNPLMVAYCLIRPEEHGALFAHSLYLKRAFSRLFSATDIIPNNTIVSYVTEANIPLVWGLGRVFQRKPLSLLSFRDILLARK